MNNAIKVGMAFAGAAAIAVGGTAFTASNTMPGDVGMGYGNTVVSGINVASTDYTYTGSGTNVELTEVKYTSVSDPVYADPFDDDTDAVLGINGTAQTGTACTLSSAANVVTITCAVDDPDGEGLLTGALVSGITSISLTVSPDET